MTKRSAITRTAVIAGDTNSDFGWPPIAEGVANIIAARYFPKHGGDLSTDNIGDQSN